MRKTMKKITAMLLAAVMVLPLVPLTASAASKTFEAHIFQTSSGAMSVNWYQFRVDSTKTTITHPTNVNVKGPDGNDVPAQRLSLNVDTSDEQSRMDMVFYKSAKSYTQSVYPFALFKTSAARNTFINNNAGALKWKNINKNNLVELSYIGPFTVGGSTPSTPPAGYVIDETATQIRFDNRSLAEGGYMVMEELPFQADAVKTTIALKNNITLSGDALAYENSYDNSVTVTYTNTASYPIFIDAPAPKVASLDPRLSGISLDAVEPYIGGTAQWWNAHRTYGQCLPMYLLPGEKVTVDWKCNFKGIDSPLLETTAFSLYADTVINTTSPSHMANGGEVVRASSYYALPGSMTAEFDIFGVYPTKLNSDEAKIITLSLLNPDKLYSATVKDGGTTKGTYSFDDLVATGTDGVYTLDISTAVGTTPGVFTLEIKGGSKTYTITIETATNYEVYEPANTATRLVVAQDNAKNLDIFTYDPHYAENKTLIDIVGYATRTVITDKWNIGDGARINGLLVLSGGATLEKSGSTVTLTPVGSAKLMYNGKYAVTGDGDWSITLNNTESYVSDPLSLDASVSVPTIEFAAKDRTFVFNDSPPVANIEGVRLYRSSVSFAGEINLANYANGPLADVFNAYIELDDARFDADGLRGIKGGGGFNVGVGDPFGVLSAGAELEVWIDTLPETNMKHFGAEGSIDISFVLGVSGSIEFAELYSDLKGGGLKSVWFLNSIYAEIGDPLQIPIPVLPIFSITALGAGFTDFVKLARWEDQYEYENNVIPPMTITGTIGISDVFEGVLISSKGSFTAGPSTMMFSDMGVDMLVVIKIVDAYGGVTLVDTGKRVRIGGKDIPLIKSELSLGGGLTLLDFLQGNASAKFIFDPSKNDGAQAIINSLNNMRSMEDIESVLKNGADRILIDCLDISYSGKVRMLVPRALPFAGHEVVSAELSGNKTFIQGKGTFKVQLGFTFDGNRYGLHEDVYALVSYSFEKKNFSAEAGRVRGFMMPQAGDAGSPVVYEDTVYDSDGSAVPIYYTSSFVPVTKNASVSLFAFGGNYLPTITQTLEDKDFIINLRSLSDQTGVSIESTSGVTLSASAAELNWTLDSEAGYYEATVPFKRDALAISVGVNFAGDWTVTATGGTIDADFYYIVEPATMTGISYNAGTFNWTNSNLESASGYRVSFALSETDDIIDLGHNVATASWTAGSTKISYALESDEALTNQQGIPSGSYYIRATLEKYIGKDEDGYDIWMPVGVFFSDSNSVNHTNPKQPGAITGISADNTVGNGMAKISWTAPSDTTNLSGYQVELSGTDDVVISIFEIDASDAELYITAQENGTVKFGESFNVTVTPFYKNTEAGTNVYGTGATVINVTIAEPNPPTISGLARIEPYSVRKEYITGGNSYPENLAGLTIHSNSAFTLEITHTDAKSISARISEELSAYAAAYDPATPTPVTFSSFSGATRTNPNTSTITLAGLSEGTYTLEFTLFSQTGNDSSTFKITLIVDDTTPYLEITGEEDTPNGLVVSGGTDIGATLLFNGTDITNELVGGAFTTSLTGNEKYYLFEATDLAGNVTSVTNSFAILQLAPGDTTSTIEIVTADRILLGATDASTSIKRLDSGGDEISFPALNSGDVEWSVISGNDSLAINATTGAITPVKVGAATIQATYLGILTDVFTVTVTDSLGIDDLYVYDSNDTSATLRFTEPTGGTKALQYSFDQLTWQTMSDAAFNGSGEVETDTLDAGKTYYFNILVTGGDRPGTSNTAAKMGSISSVPIYVVALSNSNPDGSNTLTGDPGSGDTGVGTTAQTIPAADGAVLVNFTQSGGYITLTLPSDKLNEIIGESTGTAIFDLTEIANATTVIFPKAAMNTLSGAGLDVEVRLPQGTVTLDAEAAASVAAQAGGTDISIQLRQAELSSLTAAQRAALKNGDVVFDISIMSGTQSITTFDGALTVTVPYSGLLLVGVWYLNSSGELEELNCTYDPVTKTVSFTLDHLSLYVVGYNKNVVWVNPFTDVRENDWFFDAVRFAHQNSLFSGTSATTYSPNITMTRGMMVTVLWRLAGSPATGGATFTDVPVGEWYAPAVNWAATNGIVSGIGDNLFAPEAEIKREEMAVMLYNYAVFIDAELPQKRSGAFADEEKISAWANTAVNAMYAAEILNGKGANTFDPLGRATRAEVATLFMKFTQALAE